MQYQDNLAEPLLQFHDQLNHVERVQPQFGEPPLSHTLRVDAQPPGDQVDEPLRFGVDKASA